MLSAGGNTRRARALVLASAGCLCALLLALLLPGSAGSAPLRMLTLGLTPAPPKPSCPGKVVNGQPVDPCFVEGHVTGFQTAAEGIAKPYEAPFEGKLVAWSVTLSKPSTKVTATTQNEVEAFNQLLGEPSEARISILRPIKESKPPEYKLVRQSPVVTLNRYFGQTPVFVLDQPLTVLKGQIVALTIPTWAPMFAVELSPEDKWRGSRAPEHCTEKEDIQNGKPQETIGSTAVYGCAYSDARLLYTATLVQKP